MTNGGVEKRLNKVIHDTLNGHWPFNMYQMILSFLFLEYYFVGMF